MKINGEIKLGIRVIIKREGTRVCVWTKMKELTIAQSCATLSVTFLFTFTFVLAARSAKRVSKI